MTNTSLTGSDSQAEKSRQVATQICTLRFSDGQSVTGRIETISPHEESAVVYAGAMERLPLLQERADSILLRALFRSFGRELHAAFAEKLIGSWAQSSEEPEGEQG